MRLPVLLRTTHLADPSHAEGTAPPDPLANGHLADSLGADRCPAAPQDACGGKENPIDDALFGSLAMRRNAVLAATHNLRRQSLRACLHINPAALMTTQDVTILDAGPTLRGCMLLPSGYDSARTPTVLFLSGSGAPAAHYAAPIAASYVAQGAAVMVVDYRGYGLSDGAPSNEGLYADAQRMLAYLGRHVGVPNHHVLVHGFSMGAALAAELAARVTEACALKLGGLVFDRPMASVMDGAEADLTVGLGWLGGLVTGSTGCSMNLARKLHRIDPATPLVLVTGKKDCLGVNGDNLAAQCVALGFNLDGSVVDGSDDGDDGRRLMAHSRATLEALLGRLRAPAPPPDAAHVPHARVRGIPD